MCTFNSCLSPCQFDFCKLCPKNFPLKKHEKTSVAKAREVEQVLWKLPITVISAPTATRSQQWEVAPGNGRV